MDQSACQSESSGPAQDSDSLYEAASTSKSSSDGSDSLTLTIQPSP